MSGSAIFAIVVIGLIVVALAFFLIRIIVGLHQVIDTLGKVVFGVRAIAHSTEPITPVVTDINRNLSAVAGALEAELAKAADPSRIKVAARAPAAPAAADAPTASDAPPAPEPATARPSRRDDAKPPTPTGIYRSLRDRS